MRRDGSVPGESHRTAAALNNSGSQAGDCPRENMLVVLSTGQSHFAHLNWSVSATLTEESSLDNKSAAPSSSSSDNVMADDDTGSDDAIADHNAAVDVKTVRLSSRTSSIHSPTVPTQITSFVPEANNVFEDDNSDNETYANSEQTDSYSTDPNEDDSALIEDEDMERADSSDADRDSSGTDADLVDWYSDDRFPGKDHCIVLIKGIGQSQVVVQTASTFSCTCGESRTSM